MTLQTNKLWNWLKARIWIVCGVWVLVLGVLVAWLWSWTWWTWWPWS